MKSDGGGVRRVTAHPERDDYPCWHPDRNALLLVCERAGAFDLHEADLTALLDEDVAASR